MNFFDETFLVFISLVIFLTALMYMRIPSKILSFLDAHADKVRDEILEARRLREESENILVQYKEKYSKVEKEVSEIILAAKQKAKIIEYDNHRHVQKIFFVHRVDLEKKINHMELEAKRSFYIKVADYSLESIREIISKNMNDSFNNQIFEDRISDIQLRHKNFFQ
ncbi:F0F1 ATP synthase subunit B [Candidatus Liberibacter africanus]|uniref:F0F1 ATP synthase subunit B family protein n=1 Tax=Liberibacter africanus TaxID=34020 RepID=UPI001AEA2199|nr:F0F1 ATP synthase subunit B [Candidatus Liberibacter africanus]QTP64306.1 F0F1 ATP synthase subunit B [Candidatus Liberibacter africanus]